MAEWELGKSSFQKATIKLYKIVKNINFRIRGIHKIEKCLLMEKLLNFRWKVEFCGVPAWSWSHSPPPGSVSTLVMQEQGKPWKPAVSLEEWLYLIWSGMWKTHASGIVNDSKHLSSKQTGKAS